jgi:hypothetical protein
MNDNNYYNFHAYDQIYYNNDHAYELKITKAVRTAMTNTTVNTITEFSNKQTMTKTTATMTQP